MKVKHQHYFYYDNKTGQSLGIFLKEPEEDDFAIEIDHSFASKFYTGELDLSEHYVTLIKGNLEIVKKHLNVTNSYSFRGKTHYDIKDYIEDADCQVIWNYKDRSWNFYFSEKCKDFFNSGLILRKIFFFVTLKSDYDFLIRIIDIETDDVLKNNSLSIPFSSHFENDIKKVSISTYAVFSSYSLKVSNE